MTRVTLGTSRVRESRLPGSVRAKAKWLTYSTTIHIIPGPLLYDQLRARLESAVATGERDVLRLAMRAIRNQRSELAKRHTS
ncbi:hypothetical protein ABIB08_009063 [Bradyrhizobium sp. RT11b]